MTSKIPFQQIFRSRTLSSDTTIPSQRAQSPISPLPASSSSSLQTSPVVSPTKRKSRVQRPVVATLDRFDSFNMSSAPAPRGTRTAKMLEYERQAEERTREMMVMRTEQMRMLEETMAIQKEQERIAQEEYEMQQYYGQYPAQLILTFVSDVTGLFLSSEEE